MGRADLSRAGRRSADDGRIYVRNARAGQHSNGRYRRVHRPLPPLPGMLSEPPGADPHAGWCGRRRGEPGAYPTNPPLLLDATAGSPEPADVRVLSQKHG
jgi:hypothetical protein